MTKEELIKQCRYYKGEEKNPFSEDKDKGLAWLIEYRFVSSMPDISAMIEDYKMYGLEDFHPDDGIPVELKSVLANRFFQYSDRIDIPGFKRFYEACYSK